MLMLDANILVRAILGSKVQLLLRKYAGEVEFLAPDVAFREAREHLPDVLARRGIAIAPAMEILDLVAGLVRTVDPDTYLPYEAVARKRIERRDEQDWPVLAAALAMGCPIGTEDADFFGCGVATWTTDRVELYLAKASDREM
jgi:predicted nucleic acid-binding protein